MITTILFILLVIGILVLMRYPLVRFQDFEEEKLQAAGAAKQSLSPECAAFQEFCIGKCKYRLICPHKNGAREKGTCLEYELVTNALW